MKNARLIAFELINDILRNNAYSNLALDSALKKCSDKDKGFVSKLVLGVVESKITLDYLINMFINSKPKPKVLILLYIGVYQLYFMNKVPSPVAINETVSLASEVGCSYYKGLINAVLHKIDSTRIDINLIEDKSIRFSCPKHLIAMWEKMYGEENTDNILLSLNSKAVDFAIPNNIYVNAEELQYELLCEGVESEVVNGVLKLKSGIDVKTLKAFENGLFHIEDLSSYECALSLNASCDEIIFDVCSAPGGKAFTIAERMNNTGKIYAFDIHQSRVNLIQNGAKRLGLTNIEASINDAAVFNGELPKADKILCDVPCSGFGIIRRKPEIRYKELDSVKELPKLQYKILKTSSLYLKEGGRLVYSTCTLNKRENESVVEKFLENNTNFELSMQRTIFPSLNGGDGFYFAVLNKKYD